MINTNGAKNFLEFNPQVAWIMLQTAPPKLLFTGMEIGRLYSCARTKNLPPTLRKHYMHIVNDVMLLSSHENMKKQELRQAGHYMPMASNTMQYINWLLYNSVLRL